MFIVEINSNQLMNAGQIPTNLRDHVGVPKFEVTTRRTQSLAVAVALSREYAGENIPKYSLLH